MFDKFIGLYYNYLKNHNNIVSVKLFCFTRNIILVDGEKELLPTVKWTERPRAKIFVKFKG